MVGYDALWAQVWGDELAHGAAPSFEAYRAPTPHPLTILAGVLLSPLGADALEAWRWLSLASTVALAAGAYALGRALVGPLVGAVFAVLLVTREPVVIGLLQALIDVPFLALTLWGVVAALRAPGGRASFALFSLAGLARPEAWLVTAVYAAWAYRAGEVRGPAAIAWTLAAPLTWAALDLAVTGDPLHSLHGTRELADALERPTGTGLSLAAMPAFFELALGAGVALAGIGGALLALRSPIGRRMVVPGTLLFLGMISFLALGLAGLPLLVRYVLLPTAMLTLFAALVIGAGRRGTPRRLWVVAAVAAVALIAAGLPAEVTRASRLRDITTERGRLEGDVLALARETKVVRAASRCGPVEVATALMIPLVVLGLGDSRASVTAVHDGSTGSRMWIGPASSAGERLIIDLNERTVAGTPPPGHAEIARSGAFAATSRC
jgi:hypothetical protein